MIFGLLGAARMLGRAGSGPKRPPADPKTSAIAWAVVIDLVWACYWWPALIFGAGALLIAALAAHNRRATERSAPDPLKAALLRDLLAKYDDNGRRKP